MMDAKKVDVIGGLDGIAQWCREDCGNEAGAREVEKIRDAVAELIESAKSLDATYGWHWDRDDGAAVVLPHKVHEFEESINRLTIALSRIGAHA